LIQFFVFFLPVCHLISAKVGNLLVSACERMGIKDLTWGEKHKIGKNGREVVYNKVFAVYRKRLVKAEKARSGGKSPGSLDQRGKWGK